ncbi:hypothetical protein HZB90_04525 [archaeon]|nr:hypothetical protein [archaeon]
MSPIEKLLLADPHVKRIDHPRYEIPAVDYCLWQDKKNAEKAITSVVEYLQAPCVVDIFGVDHGARHRWEATLPKSAQEMLDRNPVGANSLSVVGGKLYQLGQGDRGTNPEEFAHLRDGTFNDFPDPWYAVPAAEKFRLVARTKTRPYAMLQFLSRQTRAKKK